ncbi:DUF5819 family protein [Streptomyces sp. JJ38]|uniref:DUF5819 family protein n=1 Tax=Streptomyces sp. JJ38 TaxID=2738128 RepID=UPI001C599572|nr:DUF5819 family protein [Streptomyces sp. JJ38]
MESNEQPPTRRPTAPSWARDAASPQATGADGPTGPADAAPGTAEAPGPREVSDTDDGPGPAAAHDPDPAATPGSDAAAAHDPGSGPGSDRGAARGSDQAPAVPALSGLAGPPPGDAAGGVISLPLASKLVLIAAAAVLAVVVAAHLAAVFLHVAPSNTVSRQHDETLDEYIYPEFEQNWRLFAPNPLQQNIAVHARAEIRDEDGTLRRTGWVDLTAIDAENIRGNPFPSHTDQNELRRAWDFFKGSHDDDNQPTGPRGEMSETYLKRIAMLRLGDRLDVDRVTKLQLRSARTTVERPEWSNESVDTSTRYRVLPWWPVASADIPEAAR